MLSRKPGPPVPPRPTPSAVAQATKNRENSPPLQSIQHGRTVIYKSPSMILNNNNDDSSKNISYGIKKSKTDINISNDNEIKQNNRNVELITKSNENSHSDIKKKSPVPRPRLNNNNNRNSIENTTKIDEFLLINNSNDVKEGLAEQPKEKSFIEIENNIRNSNHVNKLFTEIIINSSPIVEAKNNDIKLEHCISVSPVNNNSTKYNLLKRPEPEGGEFIINPPQEFKNAGLVDKKKVAFHEILISELTAMRKSGSSSSYDKMQKSFDISPNGTQRSRIRTADWVEVGDNGKELKLTSCQISLEDSGLEDEERIDDCSSGVGDSWDSSVKDIDERYCSISGILIIL